jgi:hypothetical protein
MRKVANSEVSVTGRNSCIMKIHQVPGRTTLQSIDRTIHLHLLQQLEPNLSQTSKKRSETWFPFASLSTQPKIIRAKAPAASCSKYCEPLPTQSQTKD